MSCGRRDTDRAAQLAADDFGAVVAGIRELRRSDDPGRRRHQAEGGPPRFDHRIALVGIVATVPSWLERWIRPGDRASEDRFWRAFDRFRKEAFPGTGVFAGLDWFGEKEERIRPHIDSRFLNVQRDRDLGWSTFAARLSSCIKHSVRGVPLNRRSCTDDDPCQLHRLHVLWAAALRAEFEPILPAPVDGTARSWTSRDVVVNVRFDPLERKGSRHAPALAGDWDHVLAARCSYSAKPPQEVVVKWSALQRKERLSGLVGPDTIDGLRALRGTKDRKGTRRIRRFGWLSPSVRKRRLAELDREVASLSLKTKLVPVCGVEDCNAKAEQDSSALFDAADPAVRFLPNVRWLDPEEHRRSAPPPRRPPPGAERLDRKKSVRKSQVIQSGSMEITIRYREPVAQVPKEAVDPWICARCQAPIYTAHRPTWCLKDHGGCGRHWTDTAFHRPIDDGIRLPSEWWDLEYDRVLQGIEARGPEETIRILDAHGTHRWPVRPASCELCRIEDVRPALSTEKGRSVGV